MASENLTVRVLLQHVVFGYCGLTNRFCFEAEVSQQINTEMPDWRKKMAMLSLLFFLFFIQALEKKVPFVLPVWFI